MDTNIIIMYNIETIAQHLSYAYTHTHINAEIIKRKIYSINTYHFGGDEIIVCLVLFFRI